jgi:hypothetical protein
MARDISSGFLTEIDASLLRPIILTKAEFDSGDLRLWTGLGELTYNSEIYTGSGDLLKMNSVAETQSLSANNVSFEISGLPSSILSIALSEDYQDRPISAHFGVLDENFALIAEPYQIFAGQMDVMGIRDDGKTSTINVDTESELILLKESGEQRYTPEDQKALYPNDLGFDFVPVVKDLELSFGSGRTD